MAQNQVQVWKYCSEPGTDTVTWLITRYRFRDMAQNQAQIRKHGSHPGTGIEKWLEPDTATKTCVRTRRRSGHMTEYYY